MKVRAIVMSSNVASKLQSDFLVEIGKDSNLQKLERLQIDSILLKFVAVLADHEKNHGFDHETEPGRVY